MNLTPKLLGELTESRMIAITPEQRAILLSRYRHEPRYGWDEEDLVYGIHEVIRQYPDHRKKTKLPIGLCLGMGSDCARCCRGDGRESR